ncbi:MAG TPA: LacI family DNA-binding transcriptional regulator [Armatimonadota bacterium]|jgi:DNA-binding LacI/PurR family transcriptional regulator
MKQRVTQASIAKEAGVSCAAVSMVISGNPRSTIAPDTRDRILSAAKALGYSGPITPKQTPAQTIGYILNNPNVSLTAPGALSYEIINYLEQLGFDLVIAYREQLQASQLPDWILQRRVVGVIVQGFDEPSMLQQYLPAVSLNHDTAACVEGIDSVAPDNAAGVRKALDHLRALGHRRVAFFSMSDHPHFYERLQGYRTWFAEMGLPIPDDFIAKDDAPAPTPAEVEAYASRTMQRWMALPEPPTAVLSVNDWFAVQLMAAAQSLGIAVPAQLSFVGFDNSTLCGTCTPSLTSVQQPISAISRMAVQLLLDRINGIERPQTRVRMDVELIPRASTVAPCATPVALLV